MLSHGWHVQIETNGTYHQDDFPYLGDVTLVVSPKVGKVHEKLRPYVRHLKYVVTAGRQRAADGLPEYVLGNARPVEPPWEDFKGTVWIQPADSQNDEINRANAEACVEAVLVKGHRLSYQIHKPLGLE
jgi:organic radical activating enzyme